MLAEAIGATAFAARRRGIIIEQRLEPGHLTALDRLRVARLIEEALIAATEAATTGGRLRVSLTGDGVNVRILIEDDGADDRVLRLTAEQTSKLEETPTSGRAFDKAWLRKRGGDLRTGVSDLGGVLSEIVLPAVKAEHAA